MAVVILATLSVQSGALALLKNTFLNVDFQNLIVAVLSATAAMVAYYYYLFTFYEKRKIDELSKFSCFEKLAYWFFYRFPVPFYCYTCHVFREVIRNCFLLYDQSAEPILTAI